MNLLQARTRVRRRTRHVNDTVRLTDTILNEILNDKYIELRIELQKICPRFGLQTGSNLTVELGDDLSTGGTQNIHRIERYVGDEWVPVPRADDVWPDRHMVSYVSWELRGGCIILHPEDTISSAEYGEFRVIYYITPTELSDDAHQFELPTAALPVLIYRACAEVLGDDGDANKAKYFSEKAAETLERAEPSLVAEYGVHETETFREVIGW